tara:strand:- start:316 stop:660 length:345 start_codon:yes stop_codon:yes gene_type:complete
MSYNFINKIQPGTAIKSLNPNAKYVVRGGDKGIDACSIEWQNGTPEISKADIKTEINRLQTEFDNKEYQRNREASYPSLREFAEAYTEKEIGGDSTKWDAYKTKYNKVRSDNPK